MSKTICRYKIGKDRITQITEIVRETTGYYEGWFKIVRKEFINGRYWTTTNSNYYASEQEAKRYA